MLLARSKPARTPPASPDDDDDQPGIHVEVAVFLVLFCGRAEHLAVSTLSAPSVSQELS